MNHRAGSLPLLALLALSACATTSVQDLPMPDQGMEIEDPARSRIYFLRQPQVYGSARLVRVYLGGRRMGRIEKDDYLCVEFPPGRRLVRVVFEGRELDRGERDGFLDLTTEPGAVYYCGISIDPSEGGPIAQLLSREEGLELRAERSPAPTD